jgi:uncharacterized tellurite resistance protein B-like protein
MTDDDPTSEFDLHDLRLAFAYHVVHQIVGADQTLDASELRFVKHRFPASKLQRAGFLDASGGLTTRYTRAAGEAVIELPTRLTRLEKLAVLDLLLDASLADGEFHPAEGRLLLHAARLLGLSTADVDAHLSTREGEVTDIELSTQEWER